MLNRDWLKRFDVTEIVLPVGFAEAIFGGREATTGNASAVRRLGRAKLLGDVNMTNGLNNFLKIKMIIIEKYSCYTSSKVVVLAKIKY